MNKIMNDKQVSDRVPEGLKKEEMGSRKTPVRV